MPRKMFTKEELSMTRKKLISHGYTADQATAEVARMIETAEQNHEKARLASRIAPKSFSDIFKDLKGGANGKGETRFR